MMKIRKAIVTAAGASQRSLPLQRLVDRDGVEKSALQIVIEEIVSAGVDEIALVVCPGDGDSYRQAAGDHAGRLHMVEQHNPRGYGDAILRAADFARDEPVLHLVSDHLYVSRESQRCAQQVVEIASSQSCSVSAVQSTRESMLPYYGTIGGRLVPQQQRLYEVENVIEKPTPTQAEQQLTVPGLRAGHYLCVFGVHVLMPSVMELLAAELAATPPGRNLQLSAALANVAQRERYLALEVAGDRYNIGVKYGILNAQLALALSGKDRQAVLTDMLELLASRDRQTESLATAN